VVEYDQGLLRFVATPKVTQEDVVLPDQIWDGIWKNSVRLVDRIDSFMEFPEGIRRSMLLHGPPGTGKTQVFRAVAHTLGNSKKCTIIWASGRSFKEPEDIDMLYEACRDLAPSVLLIEDIDLISVSREDMPSGWNPRASVLGELLTQMDGAQPNKNLITFASTNDKDALDIALKNRPGRMDRIWEIGYPSEAVRRHMIGRFLTAYGLGDLTLEEKEWDSVISLTEGFSGAHVKEAVKTLLIDVTDKGGQVTAKDLTVTSLREAVAEVRDNFGLGKTKQGSMKPTSAARLGKLRRSKQCLT